MKRSRKTGSVSLGNIFHCAQFHRIHAILEKGFDELINLSFCLLKHKFSPCPEVVSASSVEQVAKWLQVPFLCVRDLGLELQSDVCLGPEQC